MHILWTSVEREDQVHHQLPLNLGTAEFSAKSVEGGVKVMLEREDTELTECVRSLFHTSPVPRCERENR